MIPVSRGKILFISITFFYILNLYPNIYNPPENIASAENIFRKLLKRFTSRPTRKGIPPTNRKGTANRDGCPHTNQELTALVPISKKGTSYIEKTTAAYPTWYFYIPYQPRIGRKVEFALLDAEENIVFKKIFPLNKTPGIVRMQLLKDTDKLKRGLELDQTYLWSFSVICYPSNPSGNATVNGFIKRVSSNFISEKIRLTNPKKHHLLYAENLIWFDMINELTILREKYPKDYNLEEDWNLFMRSQKLKFIPVNPISNLLE